MKIEPRTPVIVGAGQVVRHEPADAESCEPVRMMVDSLRLAAEDSGGGERLLRQADSVRCVPVIGWPYGDAAALVAEDLGASPRETVQSEYGLATAVGWYLTKHAIGIYSSRPPQKPFASLDPPVDNPPRRRLLREYAGPASVEAHTVTYARDGTPETLIVTALTPDGERILARSVDRRVIEQLSDGDLTGSTFKIDTASNPAIVV